MGTLSEFFLSIEILRPYMDYLDFRVAGDTRRIWINPKAQRKRESALRGIAFHAPAHSQMSAVKLGYFDAILIGNFMTAEPRGMGLYPHFTPIVSKLAGASGVKTFEAWRKFRWRYLRRNPPATLNGTSPRNWRGWRTSPREWADRLHIKRPLKLIYRKYLGDPVG